MTQRRLRDGSNDLVQTLEKDDGKKILNSSPIFSLNLPYLT